MIRVDRIESPAELDAVAAEWDALVRLCPARDVFLSHAWLSLWWRHFGAGRRLHVLRLREDGGTIGFAPLLLERVRRRGLPVRQLRLPLNGCTTQSGLILPLRRDEVFPALVRHLEEEAADWDVIDLDGLPETGGDLPQLERALAGSSLSQVKRHRFETLFLDYPEGPEAWFRSRTKHFRRKTRVSRNRLQRCGRLAFRRFVAPGDLDAAFDRMLDIESRTWKAGGGGAIGGRPDRLAFYRDVLRTFGGRGECCIRLLEVDDRPVAGSLVVEQGDVVQGLRLFVDPALAAASPGMALLDDLVRDSWREGLRCIALDRRTPFLSRWATRAEGHQGVFLFHRRPWSRLLRLLWRAGALVRRPSRALPQAAAAAGGETDADGEDGRD